MPAPRRLLTALPIPTGRAVMGILSSLEKALAGVGPALAPLPANDKIASATLRSAFATDTPLAIQEDDDTDPTALVIATSGSTGTPKGSLLSASALAASAAATEDRLGRGPWLLALPGHHIAGMQVLLRSVVAGTEPTVLDTQYPFTPERFITAVGQMPAGNRYVSLVPTQLHRLAAGPPEGLAALRTFTAVLVGGAATPVPLQDQIRAAGVHLVTTYGMSETCGGCVYDGLPLRGVTVTCDPADTGRITISGPMVARGYRGLPDHLAFAQPGSYRTDDLGAWTDTDGQLANPPRLVVLGRADDVIITGGVKISPGPVESTLSALPTVAEVFLTGVPSAEWGTEIVAVLTVPAGQPAPSLDDLRALIIKEHGSPAAPRHLLVVDKIPTRGPGKPDRQQLAAIARIAIHPGSDGPGIR